VIQNIGLIITKIQDYLQAQTFCRELKILQNCVFIFLKLFIDFKEIANDKTNLSLAFFALSQKLMSRNNNLDKN
jgi:hypothetical protein